MEFDWLGVALAMVGGIALFLYGVNELAERLREAASDRFQAVLRKSAGNRATGLASGAAATVVLDSSSVTIILVIALVHAGLVPFAASLPVILGSNIGTTVSSQIFASDLDRWAPLILALGLLLKVVLKGQAKAWAGALFGLGLVLFALGFMGDAVEPLKDHPKVADQLRRFEQPLLGLAAGAVATVILQSSSAMLGIVIVMAGQGLITLEAGVAMMLGSEIGTCADTLVATIGRQAAAVRAGVFHLVFNLISAGVGLLFIEQLDAFARWSADDVDRQIANAHVAFNVAGALVFLPFTPWIARTLEALIPDRRSAEAAAPA